MENDFDLSHVESSILISSDDEKTPLPRGIKRKAKPHGAEKIKKKLFSNNEEQGLRVRDEKGETSTLIMNAKAKKYIVKINANLLQVKDDLKLLKKVKKYLNKKICKKINNNKKTKK